MDFDLSSFEQPLKNRIVASLPQEILTLDGVENKYDLVQRKYDGHRVIVDYSEDEPVFLNRKGTVYSAGPFKAKITEVFRGYILDGEYMPKSGRYFYFDVLKRPEDDRIMYERPYSERFVCVPTPCSETCKRVETLQLLNQINVNRSDFENKRLSILRFIDEARKVPYTDGVIFKNLDDVYRPGDASLFRKYKFVSDIDCHVTKVGIDSKANCELSLHDPLSGQDFAVGKASTNGKGKIDVGDVVTVRFLKFTGSRLREPRIMTVRDDKFAHECTVDQLIPFTQIQNQNPQE